MSERDEYGRLTWDEEHFKKRFEERMELERSQRETRRAPPEPIDSSELRHLTPHEHFVDLTHGINKRKVIGEDVPLSKIGHYSCPVCELYFKDSSVYLRHLNSEEHNGRMGMSLQVVPVSDEDVVRRVQQWEDFYTTGAPVPPLYDAGE